MNQMHHPHYCGCKQMLAYQCPESRLHFDLNTREKTTTTNKDSHFLVIYSGAFHKDVPSA